MSAIINRSVYEPGGIAWLLTDGKCKPLPADVAYVVSDHTGRKQVTWEEVMMQRRRRQKDMLEYLRAEPEACCLPCYVWVFDNGPIIPYGGWWCYIVTLRWQRPVNFRGFNESVAGSLLRECPLVLPLETVEKSFDAWMPEFAKRYRVKGQRRRQGKLIGWFSDNAFSLKKPERTR